MDRSRRVIPWSWALPLFVGFLLVITSCLHFLSYERAAGTAATQTVRTKPSPWQHQASRSDPNTISSHTNDNTTTTNISHLPLLSTNKILRQVIRDQSNNSESPHRSFYNDSGPIHNETTATATWAEQNMTNDRNISDRNSSNTHHNTTANTRTDESEQATHNIRLSNETLLSSLSWSNASSSSDNDNSTALLSQPSDNSTSNSITATNMTSNDTNDNINTTLDSKQSTSAVIQPAPDEMVHAQVTIVTAFFPVPSKRTPDVYEQWMVNLLSLQDAMIIFVPPDWVARVQSYRRHATNRTMIVPMQLQEVPVAQMYPRKFWKRQLKKDRERKNHQSFLLFWIYLSKSWFVKQAIDVHNPHGFQSSLFLWLDAGCFRYVTYNGDTLVRHPEMVPRYRMLFSSHKPTILPSKEMFWTKRPGSRLSFYQVGGLTAGYADTWQRYYQAFMETMQLYAAHDLFIGEDQAVIQSTCRQNPTLCAYIQHADVKDPWFGLQQVVHDGGNLTYWYPPALTREDEEELACWRNSNSSRVPLCSTANYG